MFELEMRISDMRPRTKQVIRNVRMLARMLIIQRGTSTRPSNYIYIVIDDEIRSSPLGREWRLYHAIDEVRDGTAREVREESRAFESGRS